MLGSAAPLGSRCDDVLTECALERVHSLCPLAEKNSSAEELVVNFKVFTHLRMRASVSGDILMGLKIPRPLEMRNK